MKNTQNGKNKGGKFHSKHIKHDPQAESARAVFGLQKEDKPIEIRKDHITSKVSEDEVL